jgi:ParB family chromosome partitioning protein
MIKKKPKINVRAQLPNKPNHKIRINKRIMARQALDPISAARYVEKLIQKYHLTHELVAKELELSRSKVTNMLRLLSLDPETQSLIASRSLTEEHGIVLASIKDKTKQVEYATLAAKGGWSKSQLKKKMNGASENTLKPPNNENKQLERQLSDAICFPVTLEIDKKTEQAGYLKIRFNTLNELDGIMDRFLDKQLPDNW